jgi:hypothetical protein
VVTSTLARCANLSRLPADTVLLCSDDGARRRLFHATLLAAPEPDAATADVLGVLLTFVRERPVQAGGA